MRYRISLGLAFAGLVVFAIPSGAQSKALIAPGGGQPATIRAMYSEVVVVGKVAEIEKDTVEGPAYANAPKDQKLTYKVAIVKIDEPLIGAKGLTQLRIGFLADAPAVAAPAQLPGGPGGGPPRRLVRPGATVVALTAGMEGCFFVDPLPGADFYVLSAQGPPLNKKDDNYDKELKAVQAVVKTIEDPVAALKAKELDDRFQAVYALLLRYQTAKGGTGRVSREPIAAEENKLILGILAELPWLPKEGAGPGPGGQPAPSRSTLWYTVNWNEYGFRPPKNAPGMDYNHLMDEATSAFLKESADKIKLKRAVAK